MQNIEIGKTYSVTYPFVKGKNLIVNDTRDDLIEVECWIPLSKRLNGVNYDDEHEIFYVDGTGEMLATVVSVHKPGKYPTRVFFTRKWKDPDGKIFGKGKLHIVSAEKFIRMLKGFSGDYRLD